jgi:hypothetical protein
MKVYSITKITGYSLGTIMNPQWTRAEPLGKCLPLTVKQDRYVALAEAYEHYLYRLAQNTFMQLYRLPPGVYGANPLCRWVAGYYFRIFPWHHKHFDPVYAYPQIFLGKYSVQNYPDRDIGPAVRVQEENNLFLRYQERVWWGKATAYTGEGFVEYSQRQELQGKLMFEKRDRRKRGPKQDIWSFGMAWFEAYPTYLGSELYLWEWANVEYIGLGHRTSWNTGKVYVGKP